MREVMQHDPLCLRDRVVRDARPEVRGLRLLHPPRHGLRGDETRGAGDVRAEWLPALAGEWVERDRSQLNNRSVLARGQGFEIEHDMSFGHR